MEEYAHILDFLPDGRPDAPQRTGEPVAYSIGEDRFTLLELIPKDDARLLIGDRVYVGKETDERKEISRVKGRISFEEMTHVAQEEAKNVIQRIVEDNEDKYLRFFNEAQSVTTRLHMLELVPGLGKKLMWAILEERKKKSFESFEDIEERVKGVHRPAKLVADRVVKEMTDPTEKYHLFTPPPPRDDDEDYRGGRGGRGGGRR